MEADTKKRSIPNRVKNHFKEFKSTYVVCAIAVAVSTATIALQQSNAKAFMKFLDEKDIDHLEY